MILIPKRKVSVETPDGEAINSIIEHTTETIITEIRDGYNTVSSIANFDHLCRIPVGTDKYV